MSKALNPLCASTADPALRPQIVNRLGYIKKRISLYYKCVYVATSTVFLFSFSLRHSEKLLFDRNLNSDRSDVVDWFSTTADLTLVPAAKLRIRSNTFSHTRTWPVDSNLNLINNQWRKRCVDYFPVTVHPKARVLFFTYRQEHISSNDEKVARQSQLITAEY